MTRKSGALISVSTRMMAIVVCPTIPPFSVSGGQYSWDGQRLVVLLRHLCVGAPCGSLTRLHNCRRGQPHRGMRGRRRGVAGDRGPGRRCVRPTPRGGTRTEHVHAARPPRQPDQGMRRVLARPGGTLIHLGVDPVEPDHLGVGVRSPMLLHTHLLGATTIMKIGCRDVQLNAARCPRATPRYAAPTARQRRSSRGCEGSPKGDRPTATAVSRRVRVRRPHSGALGGGSLGVMTTDAAERAASPWCTASTLLPSGSRM